MTQMGFFDVENRYATLDANNDPLVKIHAVVPPAFAGAGSGKRSEAAWSKSGASQPTSVSRTQVANPGTPSSFVLRRDQEAQDVQSHHFVRPLQSVR